MVSNISGTLQSARPGPGAAAAIRVVMLDLLSMVPYYTGHLSAGLRGAEGVQVTLASITYRHDPQFFRRQGLSNDPGLLDLTSRLRRAPEAVRLALKMLEYLVNLGALLIRFVVSRPDLIHVQFLPLAGYGFPVERWFLRLVRMLGIKVVYTVHNLLPQDSGERYRASYRRTYELADRLICHDAQTATRLAREFAVMPERIQTIPHGPLFEQEAGAPVEQARARLGFAADQCVVLWQGILRPYKGISFLLQAWSQVCVNDPRSRLAIVGTGDSDLVQAVEHEVSSLGVESRVRLELRFVPVQELADFYQAADILVYPYSEITTSGALMTGILRGKAIIASALPAFEQILRHGETGLLVRYGDIDALASSLLRLIRDPGFRRGLCERLCESQARAPRWADIARRTCECYRAAISDQARWSGQPVRT